MKEWIRDFEVKTDNKSYLLRYWYNIKVDEFYHATFISGEGIADFDSVEDLEKANDIYANLTIKETSTERLENKVRALLDRVLGTYEIKAIKG